MSFNDYYKTSGQMDLTDRLAIETGLCRGENFKKIAKTIHRHPSTVSHEVLENRTFIQGTYHFGKDCRYVHGCVKKGMCGASESACNTPCKKCKGIDCRTMCARYNSIACNIPAKPPYVCNTCHDRRYCFKDRYIYTAQHADAAASRRRSGRL